MNNSNTTQSLNRQQNVQFGNIVRFEDNRLSVYIEKNWLVRLTRRLISLVNNNHVKEVLVYVYIGSQSTKKVDSADFHEVAFVKYIISSSKQSKTILFLTATYRAICYLSLTIFAVKNKKQLSVIVGWLHYDNTKG